MHTNRQYSGDAANERGSDVETDDEAKRRYSISDVISQIKRSIPDLRTVKHQPLENKGKLHKKKILSTNNLLIKS